jgi:hypothetical protein
MDEVELCERRAVRPTARKIGRPVVERAGEMEVVCNQRLDRRAILVDIGSIAPTRDLNRIVFHHYHFDRFAST